MMESKTLLSINTESFQRRFYSLSFSRTQKRRRETKKKWHSALKIMKNLTHFVNSPNKQSHCIHDYSMYFFFFHSRCLYAMQFQEWLQLLLCTTYLLSTYHLLLNKSLSVCFFSLFINNPIKCAPLLFVLVQRCFSLISDFSLFHGYHTRSVCAFCLHCLL